MGTICIHHHEYDTLAAEIIGGALISAAQVRLLGYAPSLLGLPPERSRRADCHLMLWTVSAQQHDVMRAVTRLLDAHGESYLLLRRRDAPVPSLTLPDNQWPIFEQGCDWNEYRGMLRKRVESIRRLDDAPAPWFDLASRLLPYDGAFPVTLTMLACGALLWALLS